MKKLKIISSVIAIISFTTTHQYYAMISPTERKLQKFINLASQSTVVSPDRCVHMLHSYLTLTPTQDQVLEVSEYFKYFIYTLYPRKLDMRGYNTLFSFFRHLESFGLPQTLHDSLLTALHNMPLR